MKKKEYVMPFVQVVAIKMSVILSGSDIYNPNTEYTAGGTDEGIADESDEQL